MKRLLAGLVGFVVTLVALAVGREIWLAFKERPAPEVVGAAFRWLGTFRWLYDYQTLITGLAAVAAAFFSIKAVRAQIEQVEQIESDRTLAKRAATRAMLSISLSSICNYAATCARHSCDLVALCPPNGRLPLDVSLPEYPPLPDNALKVIKEMIEFIEPQHRDVFAQLASKIQLHNSRVRGMRKDIGDRMPPGRVAITDFTVDALEVYARSSAIFDYARFKPGYVPAKPSLDDMLSSIHNVGIFGALVGEIADRIRWQMQ